MQKRNMQIKAFALTLVIGLLAIKPILSDIDYHVDGKKGKALSVNGITTHVICKDTKKLKFKNGVTMACWIKDDGSLHKDGYLGKSSSFELRRRGFNEGGIYFWLYFNKCVKNGFWSPEKFKIEKGKWTHVIVSYNTETGIGRGYINGKKIAEENMKKSNPEVENLHFDNNNRDFSIGSISGLRFNGNIDEVYLFNREVSEEEALSLFKGKPSTPKNLIGYWSFDKVKNHIFSDDSNNGHDGIVSGYDGLDGLSNLGKLRPASILIEDKELTAWTESATRKIMRGDRPFSANISENINISMAANEHEAFQVAIFPKKKLSDIKVTITDLKKDSKSIIKKEFITIRNVEYVPIVEPSNTKTTKGPVAGEAAISSNQLTGYQSKPGWHPDPLPKFTKFTASESKNYPIWITVYAPKNTTKGIYKGEISLTANEISTKTIKLHVRVYNFALPEVFHSRNTAPVSAFGMNKNVKNINRDFWAHHFVMPKIRPKPVLRFENGKAIVDTKEFDKIATYLLDELKINHFYFPLIGWNPLGAQYVEKYLGSKWYGIPKWSDKGVFNPEYLKAVQSYVRVFSNHLREKGWFSRVRILPLDEPWGKYSYNAVPVFVKAIHEVEPDIEIHITKWPIKPLVGSIDTWCLGYFQPKEMEAAYKRGEKLECYPNWHPIIDYPLMNTRMLGWMMWKYHISGILLWNTTYRWGGNPKLTWQNPAYRYPNGRVIWGNGNFLYPDKDMYPVPSIRWEILRETLEDYEYMYMLNNLIQKSSNANSALSNEAKGFLKEAVDRMVPIYEAYDDKAKWKGMKWEMDEKVMYELRNKIASYIEQLKSSVTRSAK
jgi:hypothetical protein